MAETSVSETPRKTKRSKPAAKKVSPETELPTLQVSLTGNCKKSSPRLSHPVEVLIHCRDLIKADREHFYVLHLDSKNKLLAKELIAIGSASNCIAHPREVFKGAVLNGSSSIVCVHNHPGGDPTPSDEDKAVTKRLKEAADILGVRFHDHIIIAREKYFSFSESGTMPQPSLSEPTEEEIKDRWLSENNLLQVNSLETSNGYSLGFEIDLIIQRLSFIENIFFGHPGSRKNFDNLDENGYEGLSCMIRDACTGAFVLRQALFGEEKQAA